jgi:hypothetical protein
MSPFNLPQLSRQPRVFRKISEDKMKRFFFLFVILLLLAGCTNNIQPTAVPQPTSAVQPGNPKEPTPTLAQLAPTSAAPTVTTASAAPLPTTVSALPTATSASAAPLPTATTAPPIVSPPTTGQEAILIQEPGPGWRLTSPIRVSGMADPTFEQNLVVRLLLDDGTELALTPTTIMSDVGQRGPFAVDIPFTIGGEQQAFLQVYASSARDGGLTHLSSVGITITDSGPENKPAFTSMTERIIISQPTLNTAVSGGSVHVEGTALAGFEQTLVVDVLDESGGVIGSQPILVQAPDLGLPGPFSADIPYSGSPTGPGRVVVRDLSPAFGGEVHLASVEIRFE